MSWDIALRAPCCGAASENINITYNLGAMMNEASVHPDDLAGKSAAEIIPLLVEAIKAMNMAPDKFKTLNPPNGWGSYEGLLEALHALLNMCLEHSTYIVEI